MFEKAEGTLQNIAGRVQEAVGSATGDASTEAEGKTRQAAGKVQQAYGDVLNQVRESAVTHPVGTLAMAAGAGFILGALWARR
ncbi:CsbD family protein [Variovorax sp. PAMC 28711]|uniref:CsbD family protein n=1 Tax=Variovorax sp. PAMC 28711 TaxID=1795631 RepID=UPI00078BFC58|nr:CsbD family protein [Variovorax sp. PAMC 28711]AMM23123.1 hypothetical protein AX767_01110 [Variovorax sp. PAMC 28711]